MKKAHSRDRRERMTHVSRAQTHVVRMHPYTHRRAEKAGIPIPGAHYPSTGRNDAGGENISLDLASVPMPRSAAKKLVDHPDVYVLADAGPGRDEIDWAGMPEALS